MLWPNTPILRILPGRSRTQDKIALLDILDNRLVFPRFDPLETEIPSSGKERKDKERQADAEEELHEHVGVYCRGGVSAVRHIGVWISGMFFFFPFGERQCQTVCVKLLCRQRLVDD